MKADIFVSTTFAVDGTPISQVLKECFEQGITNLELGSNHCYEDNFEQLVNSFPGRWLVHNYFPIPKENLIVNIASLDNQIYHKSINHVKKALDFCQRVRALLYTFHPGFLSDPFGASNNSKNYDFNFMRKPISSVVYEQAFLRMLSAVKQIISYAKERDVRIAIETEGSISKKDYLLMQVPDEFKKFFLHFSKEEIGINLNLGHLVLAAKAFKFAEDEMVNLLAPYIVALELSHNYGVKDDHLPLQKNGWYWRYIRDMRVKNAYKIIETRDSSLNKIKEIVNYF